MGRVWSGIYPDFYREVLAIAAGFSLRPLTPRCTSIAAIPWQLPMHRDCQRFKYRGALQGKIWMSLSITNFSLNILSTTCGWLDIHLHIAPLTFGWSNINMNIASPTCRLPNIRPTIPPTTSGSSNFHPNIAPRTSAGAIFALVSHRCHPVIKYV